MAKVKIGLIQISVPSEKATALAKAEKMIRKAAGRGAKIICLPELFATEYFPQWENADKDKYAEAVPGQTTNAMSRLARQLKVVLIVPLFEKNARGKYFNTAVVFDDRGKSLGKYHKIHIPHDPGFYEKSYFEEGSLGYKVFKTRYGKFAVLICYDQWFPEAAREARLAGAEIIFYPTAVGNILGYKPEGDWHGGWETVQRGHAIANSLYVVTVNRVGREGRMQFFGQSFVCDPFGKILKRGGKKREEVIVQELDLSRNKFFSEGWGFLRNRRPETYKTLTTSKLVEKHRGLKNVPHYQAEKLALEGK